MTKHALVVDDSKLARVVLKNMLTERGIVVDTVESAEEALGYLCQYRPDVIFMDHIMPGMSGLQAVQAIKDDPSTATIPILMYTSKEGEVYMSQARALGAIGVLPKQLKPVDLESVLDSLKLLSDQGQEPPQTNSPPPEMSKTGVIDIELEDKIDLDKLAQKAHDKTIGLSIRNTVKKMLLTNNKRMRQEFRLVALEIAETLEKNQPRNSNWIWFSGFILLFIAGGTWFSLETQKLNLALQEASAELNQLKQANAQASNQSAPVKFMSSQAAQPITQKRNLKTELPDWFINEKNTYSFNEKPFNNEQLHKLSKLVSQLANQNFKGTIRLVSHVGEFCVGHDEMGDMLLPQDNTDLGLCDINTHEVGEAQQLGMQQSRSFTNYISRFKNGNNTGIEIQITTKGKDNPLFVYQEYDQIETAGDWNKVAKMNNRVEYLILPAE